MSTLRAGRGLDSLPRNLLGQVAYHLVVDTDGHGRDPSALLPLFLTCRSIRDALAFDDFPQLYHDLFCATFDYAALQRRFDWMAKTMAAAASAGSSASTAGAGSGAGGGGTVPPPREEGKTGVLPGGSAQGPGPGQGQGKGKKMFKLFDDPRSWAIDYRTRWEMARRMKRVVRHGKLYVEGVNDEETLNADLWNIWFLITENGESVATFRSDAEPW